MLSVKKIETHSCYLASGDDFFIMHYLKTLPSSVYPLGPQKTTWCFKTSVWTSGDGFQHSVSNPLAARGNQLGVRGGEMVAGHFEGNEPSRDAPNHVVRGPLGQITPTGLESGQGNSYHTVFTPIFFFNQEIRGSRAPKRGTKSVDFRNVW